MKTGRKKEKSFLTASFLVRTYLTSSVAWTIQRNAPGIYGLDRKRSVHFAAAAAAGKVCQMTCAAAAAAAAAIEG